MCGTKGNYIAVASFSRSPSILPKRNQCNYKAVSCVSLSLDLSAHSFSYSFPSTSPAATVPTFYFRLSAAKADDFPV